MKFYKFINYLIGLGAIVSFVLSGYMFMLGFHNMDLAFNATNWGATHDRVSTGSTMRLDDLWIMGSDQMIASYWYMVLGCLSVLAYFSYWRYK